jgi:hypothetical protein
MFLQIKQQVQYLADICFYLEEYGSADICFYISRGTLLSRYLLTDKYGLADTATCAIE